MSGITPLPTPPSTSDPSNFSTRADDFLAALPTFATEANDLAAALNNISTTSSSVTSNTIGTGSKAFTVETGKSYFPGQSVTIARTAAPTNRMFAVVDSYDSGTGALVVTSQAFEGSGTFTDWTITLGFNGVISASQIADDSIPLSKLYFDLNPPVRQTVLSGPVDTNGLPSFGGSTGSTTVTASGTLIATASNGFSSKGANNRTGSINNPSWSNLNQNGTMYLYLDIAADGTCTPGAGTLAPNYRWGGADVTTNGQFTFNIQEMVGKVGNGSAAVQTYRVYVGQVTVAGSVVTAITWYALMGRYTSPLQAVPADSSRTVFSHNLGIPPEYVDGECFARYLTTFNGYATGMVSKLLNISTIVGGSNNNNADPITIESSTVLSVGSGGAGFYVSSTLGAQTTTANLPPGSGTAQIFVRAERSWN